MPSPDANAERRFYSITSVLLLATVVGGFAPTYFLRGLGESGPLGTLLHWHGAIFTAWMLLFVAQSWLIAGGRVGLHRQLGAFGAVLAVAMTVLGVAVSLAQARRGAGAPTAEQLAFLTVPLAAIAVFALNVAGAVWWRRNPATHKRLMFIATVAMLDPAIARMPFAFLGWHPLISSTCADLFWVALAVFDLARLRRVHRATLGGGILLCASQPLALFLGETGAWQRFAAWLAG
jgi:hypothetical protein